MSKNLLYHYYFIEKLTGFCFQYNNSNVPNFTYEDDKQYCLELDGKYDVLGTYRLRPDMTPAQSAVDSANWYRKVWNELDEHSKPVEESGFTWEDAEVEADG